MLSALPAGVRRFGSPLQKRAMETLLIIGVILVLLALLGFGGIISALRSAAWLILVVALVLIGLSFIF